MDTTRSLLAFILTIAFLFSAGCMQSGPAAQGTTSSSSSPAVLLTDTMVAAPWDDMVAFVDEAVVYARANGRTAALAEFSNRTGSFVRGELYIYAYDFNGTTIAHPVNPEKIGVNRFNEQDAMGTFFIRNLQAMAVNGSGFVTYSYINPAHNNAIEQKLGYVRKVDDTWWLGSGIYIGTL